MASPVLIVVSGPPGSGKTTLARAIADRVPCPMISRDAIKEGMAHAADGFVPAPGDPLSLRTLTVFFDVLELLLRAGVSVVAEAAFQDKVWSPRLEPLSHLARIRIIHCVADPATARARVERRLTKGARGAHADRELLDAIDAGELSFEMFQPIAFPAPFIHVDATDGYHPDLDAILNFVDH